MPPSPSGSAQNRRTPSTRDNAVPSALPSVWARALAASSILIAGLCGGLIGFSLADLQCTGDCSTSQGLWALIGAVVLAGGVAIVAILTLRAMDEWTSINTTTPEPGPQAATDK